MLDNLVWQPDRMLMNGLVFRLQHTRSDADWELGDECFVFYKLRGIVDEYRDFFESRKSRCEHALEIGMWDGGSLPFWFEALRPRKLIGIDILKKEDSDYFKRWIAREKLDERVRTFWGVDQADSGALRKLVDRELDGRLDVVLDDASHLYAPTRSSLETLLPLLSPRGLYIIEDWAWDHWPDFTSHPHPYATERGLTPLVVEAIAALGSSAASLIRSVTTYAGFSAVERNERPPPAQYRLTDYIFERSPLKRGGAMSQLRSVYRNTVDRLGGRPK